MSLKYIIETSEEILTSEFNIKPEKSKYVIHSINSWNDFIKNTGSDHLAQGVYLSRTLSANVKQDSEFLSINLLHEYFGHGLYCEHAINGKTILNLEQKLAEIEKKLIGVDELPKNKKFQVDQSNPFFKEYVRGLDNLNAFLSQNIYYYEGFAMWIEHFLAKQLNQETLFEKKMQTLISKDYKTIFEQFLSYSEENGNFALIAELGLPKYYDDKKIIETLQKLYKNNFDSIEFAILYGSQKPYSDIDLFIVSDKIPSGYNHWLDVYSMNSKEFKKQLDYLSISVTDPIFSGKAIIGGSTYQDNLKKIILNQTITQDAIDYNIKKSVEQGEICLQYPENSREYITGKSYQKCFKKNAEELKKGNKLLTSK